VSSEAGGSHFRRQLGNILKVIVSAGLIAYVVLTIDVRQSARAILSANPWWLLAAFAVYLITFIVRAHRWRALVTGWGARVPIKDLTIWYLVGSFFNSVLPTGFGGDILRAYELNRRVSDPVLAANSVLVDRYLGIMVLLAMGLIALPFGAGQIDLQVGLTLGALFVGGLLAGVLLLNQRIWRRGAEKLPLIGDFLSSKLAGASDVRSYYSAGSIAESALWSLAFNILLIIFNVLLGFGLGIHISLRYYLVFIPICSAVLMLPSVGGLGVRELSYATLFPRVGVASPLAVSLSLLVYLSMLAAGLIGGAIYMVSGAGGYLRDAMRR
jgi:uncharacterized membrane protein YbhN (UPF0104 family)